LVWGFRPSPVEFVAVGQFAPPISRGEAAARPPEFIMKVSYSKEDALVD